MTCQPMNLAILLIVGLVIGLTRAQSTSPRPTDELRFRGDQSGTTTSDTNVINDSTMSTPTYDPNRGQNNQLMPQNFDWQPNGNNQQPGEWQQRPRPRPFNPLSFLLTPPGFSSQMDQMPDQFSRPGSLMRELLNSPFFRNPLQMMPNPHDMERHFRQNMDESIRDLDSKPQIWSKQVQQFTINGVTYEKITFTRKVDNNKQQQQQQQGNDQIEKETNPIRTDENQNENDNGELAN